MLRIRSSILTRLLLSSAASPIFPLHHLLSTAAAAVPPNPSFAVEEYLVGTCGLTRPQALKAAAKLSHLKSPSKPNAVLAYLAGFGLSSADVAAVVAKDPKILCTGVDITLAPTVVELIKLGLSHTEIARFVMLAPRFFRFKTSVSNLLYFLSLFGSYKKIPLLLRFNSNLLQCSLDKLVKPNVALLRECGIGTCDIAKLGLASPWLLSANPERLHEMVARAKSLGVPRGSGMFRLTLRAVAFLDKEKITSKVDYLKNTLRWSNAEVGIAVSKHPNLLLRSKDILLSGSEFLFSEVGLEPAYIAHRPTLLSYSLEGRLRPRYYVVKFLKANGLLDHDRDYYSTVAYSEKVFLEKFICPHKEAAPHLAEDYGAACRGEVPVSFIFT
ncbi:uncharacterized protein LOC124689533 [Lolium rigidum]|uniref:uncharacterized protein LOC124689533 n=1 Tax=Lolium rigidum TaxID=89674 RepID=UPI001F5D7AE0|nr:uncharacterized protein LOC124689533 [Lolium rigidum]